MGCCGQRRAALRSSSPPTKPKTPPGSAPAVAHPSIALRYIEDAPIFAQGPVSGRQYRFTREQRVQSVDARDAAVLLNTRFFRRVS